MWTLTVFPGRGYCDRHDGERRYSRLGFDRDYKASLYARAAITDYWIVKLVDRVLEVRRGPMTSDDAPFGWTYERLTIFQTNEMVTPLAALAPISVADLLP